jgi:hypothetical protein
MTVCYIKYNPYRHNLDDTRFYKSFLYNDLVICNVKEKLKISVNMTQIDLIQHFFNNHFFLV